MFLTVLLLTGCATLTGSSTQGIHVQAVDALDRPLTGMRCRIINGSAEYFGDTPMFDLQVRRSATDLQIECRRGALVARGTAISRSAIGGALKALLPGGTAMLAVDHLSGYGYTYPKHIRLRAGDHLVFDVDHERRDLSSRGLGAETP